MSSLLFLLVAAIVAVRSGILPSYAWSNLLLDVVIFPFAWRYTLSLWSSIRDLIRPARYDNAEAIMQTNKEKSWGAITIIISIFGFSGLVLWYSRWFIGLSSEGPVPTAHQHLNYLDLALVSAIALEVMKFNFVIRTWKRLELTPPRLGLLFYLGISIVGAFLLLLPWSLVDDADLTVIDAFFVSVSAITVTGLSPVNIAETFTLLGMSVLLVIIHIGGIGIALFSAIVASFARKRLSLTQSKVGQEMYSVPELGSVSLFLKRVFFFTLIMEAIGTAFIYLGLPKDLSHRFFHALFHSISAFCNAGFSSLPSGLEVPGLAFMKTTVAFLIIVGGLGFPGIFEVLERVRLKNRKKLPLSSETYLTFLAAGILLTAGCLVIFVTEVIAKGSDSLNFATFAHSAFNSITARTAGFSTTSTAGLSLGAQFLILFLMIIGASPVSTGGGLKTTTVSIFIISVWNFFKGNKWLQFHKREIPYYVLHKCVAVIFCYLSLLILSVGFLVAFEKVDLWNATFESASALSTVGLTVGVTTELSSVSKLLFTFLMIAGRFGLVTLVFAGIGKLHEQRYRYPTGRFFVG